MSLVNFHNPGHKEENGFKKYATVIQQNVVSDTLAPDSYYSGQLG